MKPVDKLQSWLKVAIVVVILAYIINFAYAMWTGQSGGTFGDTFGATNALFSGVALMMLIYAVILQREELAVIKEERDDTRKLLSGQEKITALQEEALRTQIFEQTFNSILNVVLEEKARLYSITVVNSRSRRIIDGCISEATNFIRNVIWKPHESHNYFDSNIEFLIRSLFYLDEITEKTNDPAKQESLSGLIGSMLDDNISYCIFAFLLNNSHQPMMPINAKRFATRYKMREFLADQADVDETNHRAFFDEFIATLK